MCINYYKSVAKCHIIKYENSNLTFSETYIAFSQHKADRDSNYYEFSMSLFDEDKIGCLLTDHYHRYINYYITILQYENQKLSYYKNIKDIPIPGSAYFSASDKLIMIMTAEGICLLDRSFIGNELYYLSSICLKKTISLYPDLLLEFPIKQFIIPGIDQLSFSFEHIDEVLTIYKNSTEIKIGEIFHDLNNFTYL